MSVSGKAVFSNTASTQRNFGPLLSVSEGTVYKAEKYGPDEVDDQGNDGCGCDYYVYIDDDGHRCGFGAATAVEEGIISFTPDE